MIIRLTTAQLHACQAVAGELHKTWLDQAEPVGKTMWDAPMPPIGWRQILDALTKETFNVHGQRKSRVAGSMHRAVKRVATSLAHLEAHPAFSANGVALPGEHSTVFLSWGLTGRRSPYPIRDETCVLLCPNWGTTGGIRVTWWFPVFTFAYGDEMLQPKAHMAFIDGQRDRADATER